MSDLHVVILAAGKGTRMKSSTPKVLHRLAGRSLIEHVLHATSPLGAAETVLVVGHGAEEVQLALAARPGLKFVEQSPQLGTGHALLQAEAVLAGKAGAVLLLCGDAPLVTTETLRRLFAHHPATQAAATVLTAELHDPGRYGRIVRDAAGHLTGIVEDRDATSEQRAIREVNSGIYVFAIASLFESLRRLATNNAQHEYYLTDLIALCRQDHRRVEALILDDPAEMLAVNNRVELAELTALLFARKRRAVMLDGVTLEDPATAYIDTDVTVGADTVIGPGVVINGHSTIGARCRFLAGTRITDSVIGDDVTVLDHCVIVKSSIGARVSIGPFAHLRLHSEVCDDTHIGNFVELKNTRFGQGSKAGHLSYLGDATIGADVNIGAGTITCNYDGVRKHRTVIEDGVFIGSDSQLVAPVTIGKGAYVAAGWCITGNVPADALALARSHQTVKPGWAARRRLKQAEESR